MFVLVVKVTYLGCPMLWVSWSGFLFLLCANGGLEWVEVRDCLLGRLVISELWVVENVLVVGWELVWLAEVS